MIFNLFQVNWHDFAFFDHVMYESLRQLILASQSQDAYAVFAAMDLAFAIDLCKEEGGGQVQWHFVLKHNCNSNYISECLNIRLMARSLTAL